MPRSAARRLVRVAALICAVAAVAPSNAAADRSLTAAEVDAVVAAAWPESPCPAVRVVWDETLQSRGLDGQAIGLAWDQATISWRLRECVIALDPGIAGTPRECDMRVHEAWHLAHPNEPHGESGVTSPTVGEHPACHPPAAKLTRQDQGRAAVRDILPLQGRSRAWRINCNARVSRCTAKATGARARLYGVDLDDNGVSIELLRMGRRALS